MKIMVILPRFPYPLEKGDKLRAYHQIRTLSAAGNEIYLFALSHNPVNEAAIGEMSKYCKSVRVVRLSKFLGVFRVLRNFFGVRSLQIGYWDGRKSQKACRKFEAEVQPDVIYSQMVRTIKYAAHSRLPKVIDFQDALSMNQERQMMKHRGLRYFLQHYEFKMLRSAEFNASGIFDAMTIISETDAEAIPCRKGTEIDIVRNGVDFDYFHPMECPKLYDVVFCGNMQYKPNIDAARYLVNDIMPHVWHSHPEAKVLIAGATPRPSVRQLASDRVTVSGSVDDIRPCYAQSEVFVAPMRLGSGLQNKLLEAMSMGIPCVTTQVANVSLGAAEGSEVLLGSDATTLAASITRLLDDETLRSTLAANASRFVKEGFSWEHTGHQLQAVLEKAVAKHKSDEEVELEDE